MLQTFIEEKMFDELRSKQQLGYNVQCTRKKLAGVYGMDFIIQSAEHSPIYLEAQLISFLDTFYHEIFTVEEFETYKQGVIDRKL